MDTPLLSAASPATNLYPSAPTTASNTATNPVAPLSSLIVSGTDLAFNTDAPSIPQPTVVGTLPTQSSSSSALPEGALIGIIIGGAAVLIAVVFLIVCLVRRRRKRRAKEGWQARARPASISSRSSWGLTIRPGRPSSAPTLSSSLRGHPIRRLSQTATPATSGDADSVFGRLFVGGNGRSPSVRTRTSDSHGTSTTGPYYTTREEPPPVPALPMSATVDIPRTSLPPNQSKFHMSPEKSYAPSLSSATTFFSLESTARSLLPENASEVALAPMLPSFPTPPRNKDEHAQYRKKLAERRAAKARIYGWGGGAGTSSSAASSRRPREAREWVSEMDIVPNPTPIDTDDEVDRERQRAMERLFNALEQGAESAQNSRTALVTKPMRRI